MSGKSKKSTDKEKASSAVSAFKRGGSKSKGSLNVSSMSSISSGGGEVEESVAAASATENNNITDSVSALEATNQSTMGGEDETSMEGDKSEDPADTAMNDDDNDDVDNEKKEKKKKVKLDENGKPIKKKKKFVRRAEIEINLEDFPDSDDDGFPTLTTDPDDYAIPYHVRDRTEAVKRIYRRQCINDILTGRYGSIDMVWNTTKECFEPFEKNEKYVGELFFLKKNI